MWKTLLTLVLAVALAMPVAAMAQASIYGRAHVSVDMLDDGADYTELNVSSNSSRLGFKAEKASDSGVTGFMQIEGEITYHQGNSWLSSRDTFAGLKGGFGMARIGQFDTPFKDARGPANLFGDQLGDIRNITRVGSGRFDERTPNTIHYQTPAFSGVNVNLAYSVHEGDAAQTDVKDSAISVSATYKENPVDFAVSFESYEEDASRGKRNAIRAAAGFDVNDDVTLVGFFQTIDHDDDSHDADVIGFGANFKLNSKTALKGMFLMRSGEGDDTNSNMIALGVEHRLDRALRVYAIVATAMNDDNVALTPWNQGRTVTATATAGESATGVSLGMRYDF